MKAETVKQIFTLIPYVLETDRCTITINTAIRNVSIYYYDPSNPHTGQALQFILWFDFEHHILDIYTADKKLWYKLDTFNQLVEIVKQLSKLKGEARIKYIQSMKWRD